MGKMQQHAFECVALVGQFQNDLPRLFRRTAAHLDIAAVIALAASDASDVDSRRIVTPGCDQSEFVVLFRVFDILGDHIHLHKLALAVFDLDFQRIAVPDRVKHTSERPDIRFVCVVIAVGIAVKHTVVVGCEQRRNIFETVKRKVEQLHAGIEGDRFEPLLLQQGKGHGGNMAERRAQITCDELPFFLLQCGRDGKRTFREGIFAHDALHFLLGQLALYRGGKDLGYRIVICTVELTEQHHCHRLSDRTTRTWRLYRRETAVQALGWRIRSR